MSPGKGWLAALLPASTLFVACGTSNEVLAIADRVTVLRDGAVRNPLSNDVWCADRKFKTATGRIQLIREIDPRPATPPPDRPLFLTAVATAKSQATQWPGWAGVSQLFRHVQ